MKRVMKRDGADEERARRRIASQMSNGEVIDHAHVVFCTLWEYEYTHEQVRENGENRELDGVEKNDIFIVIYRLKEHGQS